MARVLVTRRLPDGGTDPLVAAGHEIVARADDTPFTPDELRAAARDVDAIVCLLTDRIDASVLDAGAERLRVVANVAVGYDNVDVAAAREHGVTVCNTPGVLDETTADLAFLLMLAAAAPRARRRGRPADRTLDRVGHQPVPRPGRPRRHARPRRLRPHRPGGRATGHRLRHERAAPHPDRHR